VKQLGQNCHSYPALNDKIRGIKEFGWTFAPATKEKYIQRLIKFLVFLGYKGTKEEKARAFADRARAHPAHAFNSVLRFFQSKREQIDRKEMAIGTVRNYLKSTKLFCDMADLQIPWAKIAVVKSINQA
jgi:hypothetical protein